MGSRGAWMHLGGRGWVMDKCGCTADGRVWTWMGVKWTEGHRTDGTDGWVWMVMDERAGGVDERG